MIKLANEKPKRLFTFGCSFTDYKWATWANILAYELNCEFYNFGKSGAGNSFISNQITQANNVYNFDHDDLVVVCWTNISREDRWADKKGWITPGNIYSQRDYDKKFVRLWANDIHFALRDFSYIDLIRHYLESRTNFHFISMCDVKRHINQWEETNSHNKNDLKTISDMYSESLNFINPSFYEILWQNNINNKWRKDWDTVHPHFSDGHPTILEHLDYLQQIFDYKFCEETINSVNSLHEKWLSFVRKKYKKTRDTQGIYNFPQEWQDELHTRFRLAWSNNIDKSIYC